MQDSSKLLDLCRQNIIFEQLDDLCHCIAIIAADREVVVMRVKNRLDPEYNASTSAGYRDVALNLMVTSRSAAELGVDMHICEVQLVLRSMAEIKVCFLVYISHIRCALALVITFVCSDQTLEGHKRYVAFRNLLGE